MINEIEDYFSLGCGRCERFATVDCSTRRWGAGLVAFRQLCIGSKLVETLEWGHPCYMHANRNIAIIGALRNDFRLSFFHAALMKDAERLLVKQGPNTKYPDMIRFTDNAQVAAMEKTIRSYVEEAVSYAEEGIKPPKDTSGLEWPNELVEALRSDPELSDAFHRLTQGRQKSYVIQLSSAKKAGTGASRILAFGDRILAGKRQRNLDSKGRNARAGRGLRVRSRMAHPRQPTQCAFGFPQDTRVESWASALALIHLAGPRPSVPRARAECG